MAKLGTASRVATTVRAEHLPAVDEASIVALPITVIPLRNAIDMLEPTMLRSNSVSADRRDNNSPLRVRSKKL